MKIKNLVLLIAIAISNSLNSVILHKINDNRIASYRELFQASENKRKKVQYAVKGTLLTGLTGLVIWEFFLKDNKQKLDNQELNDRMHKLEEMLAAKQAHAEKEAEKEKPKSWGSSLLSIPKFMLRTAFNATTGIASMVICGKIAEMFYHALPSVSESYFFAQRSLQWHLEHNCKFAHTINDIGLFLSSAQKKGLNNDNVEEFKSLFNILTMETEKAIAYMQFVSADLFENIKAGEDSWQKNELNLRAKQIDKNIKEALTELFEYLNSSELKDLDNIRLPIIRIINNCVSFSTIEDKNSESCEEFFNNLRSLIAKGSRD